MDMDADIVGYEKLIFISVKINIGCESDISESDIDMN